MSVSTSPDEEEPKTSGGLPTDGAIALPQSLRCASLVVSPLTAHLQLFPSHRFDAEYSLGTGPPETRPTSYDLAAAEAATHGWPCASMTNTPDAWHNWTKEQQREVDREHGEGDAMLDTPQKAASTAAAAAHAPEPSPPAFSPSALEAAVRSSSAASRSTPPSSSSPHRSSQPSSPSAAASAPPPQSPTRLPPVHETEEPSRSGFVQCVKCSKWRTVPDDLVLTLPSPWQCDMNSWDPRSARCLAVEEVFEEGGLWPGLPVRFTRLVSHYTFYRRLVALLRARVGHDPASADADELDKFPTIRRRPVDLHLTYQSVIQLGGYDKVSASNQWKIVQSCLHIPEQHDSSLTLKRLYRKFLFEYESAHWKNPRAKPSPQPSSSNAVRQQSRGKHADSASAPPVGGERRKRGYKSIRSSNGLAEQDSEGEEAVEGGARKKRRHVSAAAAAALAAIQQDVDMLDEDAPEFESEGDLSKPTSLAMVLRNLRANMDAKLRMLEKRTEERIGRMEQAMLKSMRDAVSEIKEHAVAQAASSRARQAVVNKDADRKQDLLAKGMSMLISERLKANLPKLAQIKLKSKTAAASAAAAAGPTISHSSSSVVLTPLYPRSNGTRVPPAGSDVHFSVTTFVPRDSADEAMEDVAPAAAAAAPSSSTSASTGKNEPAAAVTVVKDEPASTSAPTQSGSAPSANPSAAVSPSTTAHADPPSDSDEDAPNLTLSAPPPSPQPRDWVYDRLKRADGICFDVDSTVSTDEGIDVLAGFLGPEVLAKVKALTNQAMNGDVKFEDALKARLDIMRPTEAQVIACVAAHPPQLTQGFKTFVEFLRSDHVTQGGLPIYLVSGGFRALIEPLRVALNIPEANVFANRMRFTPTGDYKAFDPTEPTSRSGGKAEALRMIAKRDGRKQLVMIGDGITDVEASPPARVMIGFGGIAQREAVKKRAHHFVTRWSQLERLFKAHSPLQPTPPAYASEIEPDDE